RVGGSCENIARRFQTQNGPDSKHGSAGGPSLRQAGCRVLYREPGSRPLVSGKNFRQAAIKCKACFKNSSDNIGCVFAEAVAGKTSGNDAAVVRPHSSVVVFD